MGYKECFLCSVNCVTCSLKDRNYCLNCGTTFNRILSNGNCDCLSGYKEVEY